MHLPKLCVTSLIFQMQMEKNTSHSNFFKIVVIKQLMLPRLAARITTNNI